MTEFITDRLYGKRVMNQNGEEIGELADITLQDDNSGELSNLIIETSENINAELRSTFNTTDTGHIILRSDLVESVKDYILVNTQQTNIS